MVHHSLTRDDQAGGVHENTVNTFQLNTLHVLHFLFYALKHKSFFKNVKNKKSEYYDKYLKIRLKH